MVSHDKAKKLIYKVLSSMPIDVFDDVEGTVWESSNFELYTPRPEGDFEGSREIGAANIVSAFNLLHQKMLIAELSKEEGFSDCADECFELLLMLWMIYKNLNLFVNVQNQFEKHLRL